MKAARPKAPVWAWVRALCGVGILVLLVWRVGLGPFLNGVRVVTGPTLAAAFGIGVAITVCCAWRWRLVAAGLGVRMSLRRAVADYYRSQFLNTTLPGGVVGDVHRAVRHGQEIGDVGLGVRSVVLERLAGQAVQAAVAMVVLLGFPSPVRSYLPVGAAGLIATVVAGVVIVRALPRARPHWWARAWHRVVRDIRDGVLARRNWVGIGLASTVVVAGHLATFLLAARTAGSTAPLAVLIPLTLLALLAMVLPVNLAGWGAREAVAAWAFGAAGLTAAQGVAAAVTYGVLGLVASLPGAAVLVLRWISRANRRAQPALGWGEAHG